LRALILDDCEDDALLLVRRLRQGGFEVAARWVRGAPDFAEALEEQPWDVVYADWVVPGFGACEALSVYQASGQDGVFIVVSGVVGEEVAVTAMKAGAHDFVSKQQPQRLVPATERELREATYRRTVREAEAAREVLLARERAARTAVENARILNELNVLKTNFINVVTHELRTPLSAIKGYAEFLEDGVGGTLGATQTGFVTRIQDNATRLERLVSELLEFAGIEAGTFRLSQQDVDVSRLVVDVSSAMAPSAAAAGVALETFLPDGPLYAWLDPWRSEQLLLNVVDNAIKFTPVGGRVTVRLRVEDDTVVMAVQDTGIGIAPAHLGLIFRKFYQADASTTRAHGGTGIGLAVSQALAEAHGGRIDVESTPGAGSTFSVRLPRHAALCEAEADGCNSPPPRP
jgi:signal transduction histidine kinase